MNDRTTAIEAWTPSSSDTFYVIAGLLLMATGAFLAAGIPGLIAALGLFALLIGLACDLRRAILEKANG